MRRVDVIQNKVAQYYEISLHNLLGSKRDPHFVRARRVAMYIARTHTDMSYPLLGAAFGKDHTTVIHAVKILLEIIAKDKGIKEEIKEIENWLPWMKESAGKK